VIPAPGFAIQTLFGEMAVVLLEGQRAVPQRLLDLGFKFKYETAQAALRNLVGSTAAESNSSAPVAEKPAESAAVKPVAAGKE
jgi:hypothetical protein